MVSRGPTSENSDMENVNKPASSWPLKQGPKSGQNMAAIRDLDSGNRAWDANIHVQACRVANLLAQYVRAAARFSDG